MAHLFKPTYSLICGLAVFAACEVAGAQSSATPAPVTFTADQDHQNMMDQLGIKALRPGPSGNEKAPNHANYDESLANPFSNLPDPLTMNNGQKSATNRLSCFNLAVSSPAQNIPSRWLTVVRSS